MIKLELYPAKSVNFSVTRSLSGEEDEESKNSGIERRAASMNYKAKNYREDGMNFNTKNKLIVIYIKKIKLMKVLNSKKIS